MKKILILAILLSSCSAQFHEQKFYKKGGSFNCDIDTLKIIDSIIVDGATKYVVRDSFVVKTDTKVITRWQTKYQYKTIRDSVKAAVKNNRIDSRQETKAVKKRELNCWTWWDKVKLGVICFVAGILFWIIYTIIRAGIKLPMK